MYEWYLPNLMFLFNLLPFYFGNLKVIDAYIIKKFQIALNKRISLYLSRFSFSESIT